jgi:hypothetical protein
MVGKMMRSIGLVTVLGLLSLAVGIGFGPNRAFADLGFGCGIQAFDFTESNYHKLSISDFGTKTYEDSPETITKCELRGLVLNKKISKADLKGLKYFAEKYPGTLARKSLWLNSPGGDLMAAISIAKFIRRKGMNTKIHGSGLCYSSCVIVLAGGVVRTFSSSAKGAQTPEPGHAIGIHRPYAVSTSSGLSETEAASQLDSYKKALKAALRELRVPTELADKMMAISPLNVKILTADEVKYYGLDGPDPIHETRMLNLKAIRDGLTLQKYIRREQLHDVQVANPHYS